MLQFFKAITMKETLKHFTRGSFRKDRCCNSLVQKEK